MLFWIAKPKSLRWGVSAWCGMLVDNAIVVVESFLPTIDGGRDEGRSRGHGNRASGGRDSASTLTTCVVFIPVLFVEGLAARLIEGIAFTVVASLLASLGGCDVFLSLRSRVGSCPKRSLQSVSILVFKSGRIWTLCPSLA
ncbi:MAG: hypothetical protein CM1200mP9_04570 [Gammaproteobacteria bacterium]|nr:MAG: hypothetical protein CM1200mP9_04570 [Gammaproteobacteria bacterium]